MTTDQMIKYNNLIKKVKARETFLKKKQEENNFGIKSYEKVNDPIYIKRTTELDQVSYKLARKLNIPFV